MTLIDTSVWVNHFRAPEARLVQLLNDGEAGTHPFVIGELAAGSLKNRAQTLRLFQRLPRTEVAEEEEVHLLLEKHRFCGSGLGWVDLHLLAAALITGWKLWSADRAMLRACQLLQLRG
jgi:predicted nucleic acid-binding protein